MKSQFRQCKPSPSPPSRMMSMLFYRLHKILAAVNVSDLLASAHFFVRLKRKHVILTNLRTPPEVFSETAQIQ